MTAQPFHHGNLRAVLLEQAEVMLRGDGGVGGLSIRALAREAGVSHGAPRSHFIDRQALLDALAERGFDRLTRSISDALTAHSTAKERFRLVGQAYVDFAVDDAALMELMFAAKIGESSGGVHDAAARLFEVLDSALVSPAPPSTTAPAGVSGEDPRDRFKLMFAATMQGIAALIAAGRITRPQGEVIVVDATDAFVESRLGAHVLPPA